MNTKLRVVEDGVYETGRTKLKVQVLGLKGEIIFESDGCLTFDQTLLINDSPLYEIKFSVEKKNNQTSLDIDAE